MRSQNILKLCGDVAIKLKSRLKDIAVVLTVCVVGFVFCIGLYFLVDNVFNGVFVEWFDSHYMIYENRYLADKDAYTVVCYPDWTAIKHLIFWAFLCAAAVCLAIAGILSSFRARKKVKQSVTAISGMLYSYMTQDKEAAEVFPKGYAEIAAQMTEIKSTMQRHEQILKEEASRKNDLIAYLAHDLKTPLTSVIGYLSLLDEAPDMPQKQRAKYVHITLDKAQRLERLINEFFEITRYNLQQIHLEKERIDLSYMLVQLTDEFFPLLQAHGNTVQLNVEENACVYGDPEKLARVFNNILKNAISYSYPDTVIAITARQMEHQMEITVQNQGKTIPAQKLDAIFEKFFRLDESRSTNTGGAGLGLAIAKEIITLHGGTITADSREEITTFRVTLPLR